MVNFLGAPLSNITGTEGSPVAPPVPAAPPPQINFLGAPLSNIQPQYGSPVPPPVPQYVDRQAWLREELLRRQAVIQQAIQPLMQWQRIAEQRELQRQREMQEALSGIGVLQPATDPLTRAGRTGIDLARTRIPFAEQATDIAQRGIQQLPLAQGLRIGEMAGVLPEGAEEGTTRFLAEAVIPQEVWQAALELIPGIGTVPDLMRAAKAGAPDAVRAVRQALDSPVGQQVMRALREGESGALKLPGGTPQRPPVPETPEDKLLSAVRTAKRVRPQEQEAQRLARQARAKEVGEAFSQTEGGFASTQAAGRAAFGELTEGDIRYSVDFTKDDADALLRTIRDSKRIPAHYNLTRLATQRALIKLLGFSKEGAKAAPHTLNRTEIKYLEQVFGPELGRELLNLSGVGFLENVLDIFNLQRAFITAFDFSMPFRQSLLMTVGHPTESIPAMWDMIRSAFDEKFAMALDESIRTADDFGQYLDDGNFYASPFDEAAELTDREELFMTRFAQAIPGVKHSQRAALNYLNKLQRDVWRQVTKHAENWTPEQRRQIGQVLNHMRGRGDVPDILKGAVPLLNWGLFSPRLFLSRIQIPLDVFLTSGPARRLVARDLAATVGTGITVLAMGRQAGVWDVQLDPRHPDFGKGKIGTTRFDFWGGEQQIARLIASLVTGQGARTNAFGKQIYDKDWRETSLRFLQSKLSPQTGLLVDIFRGETFTGEELTTKPGDIKTQAFNRLVPLFIQDVVDATREYGPIGLVGGLPSAFGISATTYETVGEKRRRIVQEAMPALTPQELDALKNGVIPNAIRDLPEWQEVNREVQEGNAELARRAETIRAAGEQLLKDHDIRAYQQTVGDARSRYRAVMEQLDLPSGGTVDEYFKQTYDRATVNGVLNPDLLDRYIDEWEAKARPDQFEAIRQMQLAADDPVERVVRDYRLALDDTGYNDRQEAWFTDWARATSVKQTTIDEFIAALTEKAVKDGKAPQRYQDDPIWKAWQRVYDRRSRPYLVQTPEADALAAILGRQENVHSMRARELFIELAKRLYGEELAPKVVQ